MGLGPHNSVAPGAARDAIRNEMPCGGAQKITAYILGVAAFEGVDGCLKRIGLSGGNRAWAWIFNFSGHHIHTQTTDICPFRGLYTRIKYKPGVMCPVSRFVFSTKFG